MGRKLVLSGTKLTDSTAPVLVTVDTLESPGSLLLLDPTHPAGPWAPGVPAAGASVPNLLGDRAVSLAGGTRSGHDVTIRRGTGWTGTAGKLERTGRGGLHGLVSQGSSVSETYFGNTADALAAYLVANPGHAYYFSLWTRITRAYPGGSAVPPDLATIANNTVPGSNYLARVGASGLGTGLRRAESTRTGWAGTAPTAASGVSLNPLLFGRIGGMNQYSTTQQLNPSHVFYRAYLEDLTVSGRTAAAVSALDSELYTREVLTVGGRYYGDTFTDPTTLP